jgi:hypothetical protein
MDTSLRAYINAFWNNWTAKVSGGLSVPFTIITVLVVRNSLQRGIFGLLAVICFLISSYDIWRNERTAKNAIAEELRSIYGHRYLRNEWERLEAKFRMPTRPGLYASWDRPVDSVDLHWWVAGGPERETERLVILMEEAGTLLSTSDLFSAKFPRVVSIANPVDRWLTAVCAMKDDPLDATATGFWEGTHYESGTLKDVVRACETVCAKLAAQETAAQVRKI